MEDLLSLGLFNNEGHLFAAAIVVALWDMKALAPVKVWLQDDKNSFSKIKIKLWLPALLLSYAGIAILALVASCQGFALDFGQVCNPDIALVEQIKQILLVTGVYAFEGVVMYDVGKFVKSLGNPSFNSIELEAVVGEFE